MESVAFAPDGKTVFTGSRDETARLWDVATGKEIRAFKGHTDEVNAVAFAPDGKSVVTGCQDSIVRQWDVATGKELRAFTGHTFRVDGVTFASDGKSLLTGSSDKTAPVGRRYGEADPHLRWPFGLGRSSGYGSGH